MDETTELAPWLPIDEVLVWLKVSRDDPELVAIAETCRVAAAAYCVEQRPDLAPEQLGEHRGLRMAALLSCARLYARRNTPTGLASFGEFGASDILRFDPDVARLLGTGRHARPRVG